MENTAYEADECEEVGSNPPGAEQDSFVPERMHDIVGEWTVKEDHRINNVLRKENCRSYLVSLQLYLYRSKPSS